MDFCINNSFNNSWAEYVSETINKEYVHPVAKVGLTGRRKHLTISLTTPKWSNGPLMSVVLPLQIPQRCSQKLYEKREQAFSK